MSWNRDEIRAAYERGNDGTHSHMIVAYDSFDYSSYPIYVPWGEDPQGKRPTNGDQVSECYSYELGWEPQAREYRSLHWSFRELAAKLSGSEAQSCSILGCSLPKGEHEAVLEPWLEAMPGSLWHSDGSTGVSWVAPAEDSAPEQSAQTRALWKTSYGPREERLQREHRSRQLDWVAPSWSASLGELAELNTELGAERPFSGDLRPAVSTVDLGTKGN